MMKWRARSVASYLWKYQASISGIAIFMISAGWMRVMPRSSQRLAPLTLIPTRKTATSSRTPTR